MMHPGERRPLTSHRGPRAALLLCLAGGLAGLPGCGTTVVRQIELGDAALARGDHDRAEREYDRALRLDPDEEGRGAWARAKIEAGRARIRIARHRRLRPWQAFAGAPAAILGQLHDLRRAIRDDGGDPELDATLDRLSRQVLTAELDTLAGRAGREPYPAARAASPLGRFGYLDRALADRLGALITAGRERAELDAVGVGDRRPLARRVYQALAAQLGGAPLDDARDLAAPYGVGVTYRGDGSPCDRGGWFAWAPQALRRATVEVTFDHCADSVTTTTTTEEQRWTSDEVVGYRTETRSWQECVEIPTDHYQCSNGVCRYSGSLSTTRCTPRSETVKIPIYAPVEHRATRTVAHHRGSLVAQGRWTVSRDGRTWSGAFGGATTVDATRGEAFEHFPSLSTGALPSFADRITASRDEARGAIDLALAEAFRPELDQASRTARDLERGGDLAAADEAWTLAVLLGGEQPGSWARHGLSTADIRAAFAPTTSSVSTAATLPAPRVFDIPPLPRRTPQDVKILEQRMVGPLGKAASLRAYGGWQELPAVTSPLTTDTLAGQGFVAVGGIVESQGLVSRRRRSQLGLGVVDGAAAFLGGGMALTGPDDAIGGGTSLLRAGASYSLGFSARHPGTVGVLAGLRADGEWFLLGNASGWHARVGGFARLELLRLNVPWTFAAQVEALDVVGDPLVAGELFWARVKKDGWQRMSRFFSLRYERRAIDAGVTVTGTSELSNPTMDVEDLTATSWTASFGIGF